MQQRRSASGRPSGTDGSDYSYRMVVDSRYTKVAKRKTRLSQIFLIQVGLIVLADIFLISLPVIKGEDPNVLAISSAAVSFISLIIGESGFSKWACKQYRETESTDYGGITQGIETVLHGTYGSGPDLRAPGLLPYERKRTGQLKGQCLPVAKGLSGWNWHRLTGSCSKGWGNVLLCNDFLLNSMLPLPAYRVPRLVFVNMVKDDTTVNKNT
ncbi:hypothetical protein Cgig2_007192 [Carnegiea gigantea]|uniref:Uncharacterized protein n=1 Tax=Carnegiea gigantea TaxID=171969 RepID=A0A9Q1GJW9_9CARY|nr:hypothetical protein Cgig2_007192 [Carnegiea gigantea]